MRMNGPAFGRVLLLAVILVLGLAACGTDGPSTEDIERGDNVTWLHIKRPDGTVMPCLRYQQTVNKGQDSAYAYFALDCDWSPR
jgi:hypothetical protein